MGALKLAYRTVGAGPPLVCHPGGPGFSARCFGDLAGVGSARTVVLLDPRGSGGSERPADARAYRLEDYAADLEQVRERLGVERIDVLGHSHGGFVAMTHASSYPDRVDRLVLVSSLARSPAEMSFEAKRGEPWYEDAIATREKRQAFGFDGAQELAELYSRELPLMLARLGEREQAWLRSLETDLPNPEALRFFNTEIAPTFDLRLRLDRIAARTLVLVGEDDLVTPPPGSEELVHGIGDAQLVVLSDCGHFPWVEQPDAFREAVLDFLR